VGSTGFLIASVVMLRSRIGRATALLGIAVTAMGIASGLDLFYTPISALVGPTLVLYGIWNVAVGAKLLRMGGRHNTDATG